MIRSREVLLQAGPAFLLTRPACPARWCLFSLVVATLTMNQGGPVAADGNSKRIDSFRVEIHESEIPVGAWPESLSDAGETYREEAMGFFHVPWRYVGTGVRADRSSPYLLRASANIDLPAGKYRLLIRSRSAARLWMGSTMLASLDFPPPIQDGHDLVRHDALVLGATRWVAPGDHEELIEFTADGSSQLFIFEVIVGGRRGNEPLRTELGESIAAIARAGSDEFHLLAPTRHVPLTDEGWEAYRRERQELYERWEAERRGRALAGQQEYWQQRHQLAAEYATTHSIPVPTPSTSLPANNEIDHFLNGPIEQGLRVARQAAGQTTDPGAADVQFHRSVQPILEARCYSCHANQPQGGLRLDDFEGARAGGDSGIPAIVPGQPEASELLQRILSEDSDLAMPLEGERVTAEEIETIRSWIAAGADWPRDFPRSLEELPSLTTDLEFLRRSSLDLTGTLPALESVREFLADSSSEKRRHWIDQLLDSPQWADAWMPYWLDVLAENPSLVNPTLNSTGPFRWWLYDALRDHKPWDIVVTELIQMEGSERGGGAAGFGLAALNDAPMAAKAGILSSALLAIDMKCARCHDAPYHSTLQAELFHTAALLARESLEVPQTSTVALDQLPGDRAPRIRVTLQPGVPVEPLWTLTRLVPEDPAVPLPPGYAEDTRARLAALITQPANERFAEVLVNRVWRRFFGRGLVEPVDDWEGAKSSHPELLAWLARQFIAHEYDLRHLSRLILNSHAYQRAASTDADENALFAAPVKRRMGPEQLADSLHDSLRVPYDTELLCLDLDSGRSQRLATNLGQPRRAWQFAYLANDRDRPSLNLPRAQVVTDLLTAFGWAGNRQEPVTDRMVDPSLLQSALLAHGATTRRLIRLTDDAYWTRRSLAAETPEALIDDAFLQILTRTATAGEMAVCRQLIGPGFEERVVESFAETPAGTARASQPYVTWANHLVEEASQVRLAEEERVRLGPPATERLETSWRERMEDLLWALINSPEMVYIP